MSKQTLANHLLYSRLALEIDGFDSLAELALDLCWSWNHATQLTGPGACRTLCVSAGSPTIYPLAFPVEKP